MKLYGPYTRKDGRKHLVVYNLETKKKTSVSYPKYLLEKKLGRKLIDDETTDHIDENFTNNEPENLQVLSRRENAIKSIKSAQTKETECPQCGEIFHALVRYIKHNQEKRGSSGPFCSRSCAGKYNAGVC